MQKLSGESDKDNSSEWSDFDLPRNNNAFKGSSSPNVLLRDANNNEDVVELFIGNDLFEFNRISEINNRKHRRCHVCYKNNKIKRTNLMCKLCGVALHLKDCFALFNLKVKY
ncbi:hypothetical protein M0802_015379 [Mischocyttarus mexicanus]|nr:hypothetical protein M0802_015379 [Mischocyttarus mexicanus]